jgi:hypothetical protein
MALMCPRCEAEVSAEAMYCSYCSLPKPKRGFDSAADETLEEATPTDQPKDGVAFKERRKTFEQTKTFEKAKKKSSNSTKRSLTRPQKPPRRLRLPVVSVAALIAFFSVAIYIFVVPLVYSEQAEPKTVSAALDVLRHMPSSETGLTVDARLARELETSKRVGNLVSYQGWSVKPVKGTKNRVLFVYSYDEVGSVHKRAEWLAILSDNTFTPRTELAVLVSKK